MRASTPKRESSSIRSLSPCQKALLRVNPIHLEARQEVEPLYFREQKPQRNPGILAAEPEEGEGVKGTHQDSVQGKAGKEFGQGHLPPIRGGRLLSSTFTKGPPRGEGYGKAAQRKPRRKAVGPLGRSRGGPPGPHPSSSGHPAPPRPCPFPGPGAKLPGCFPERGGEHRGGRAKGACFSVQWPYEL